MTLMPEPRGDDMPTLTHHVSDCAQPRSCRRLLRPQPAAATSDDLCARLAGSLMRISGRKAWRDQTVLSLAERDEDDSGVPESSFLFIRSVSAGPWTQRLAGDSVSRVPESGGSARWRVSTVL